MGLDEMRTDLESWDGTETDKKIKCIKEQYEQVE